MVRVTATYTAIGKLTIAANERGIVALCMEQERHGPSEQERSTWIPDDHRPSPTSRLLDRACEQVAAYFAGVLREFELPLDAAGTEFQHRVWDELERIPYGQTISYGELARRVGNGAAARAVGAANGHNPISIIVPCHRVIGADGSLTGYGGGIQRKRWLLEHESRHARTTLGL